LGDGGAIVTSDSEVAARVRQLRQYGWSSKYTVAMPGGRNSRLDEMQAAILSVKLPHLDRWNAERRTIATRYNEAFADLPLQLPASVGEDYVAHLYVVRTPERLALQAHLGAAGVNSDIHYPLPDHQQPAYPVERSFNLANTEQACNEVLSLPCFPGLTNEEVERVVTAVRAFFKKR
jgi:aminotransferase EvaB